MIVVMPYGRTFPVISRGSGSLRNWDNLQEFQKDFKNYIIHFVEKNYRVRTDREGRAIAGFSGGGGNSLYIGLGNPDLFAWVCGYHAILKMTTIIAAFILLFCSFEIHAQEKTYCNPGNLNYQFQLTNDTAFRKADDPLFSRYKDKYVLYASHSGGYWYSDDLLSWKFVPVRSLPIEDYVPDKLYSSIMVYDTGSLKLTGLNKDITYYFSNDAFNESGITKGTEVLND
jgi:hypothetical protein